MRMLPRFHLSTAIVATIAAGVVMYLSVKPRGGFREEAYQV